VKFRHLVIVTALSIGAGALTTSCGTAPTPAATATTAASTATTDPSLADNPFLPEDVNLGDCVSSLPRPGCGTEASTSGKTQITFLVLLLGLVFIGWRVARGVRQRDTKSPV
jgi:hypothetical protein